MKKSIYNHIVQHNGYHLVYNLLTSACVILTDVEFQNFDNFSVNKEDNDTYYHMGFYVDDDFNEVDAVYYSSLVSSHNNTLFHFRIYTTLDCNACCPYCYEKGAEPIYMDEKTADLVCQFIVNTLKEKSSVTLEWFGGEPLLNKHIIDYICLKLIPIFKEKEIVYSSRIVTNGILLNNDIVEMACGVWNLKQAQITLDGLKDTHESVKGFHCKDAFEKILDNISLLLKKNIIVTIRLNYDERNFDEIVALIEFLGDRFVNCDTLKIGAKKLMYETMDNSVISSENYDLVILKKCIEKGFIKNTLDTIHRKNNSCMAHSLDSIMILPDGKLGKCSQAMCDGDIIGNIVDGINEEKLVRWCSPRLSKRCMCCHLLPICNGGCEYERFMGKNYCFTTEMILNYKLEYYLGEYCKSQ